MKVYFFLLYGALLALQFVDALPQQNRKEPDCSQYEDGETLPDSGSCSKYFMCINGKALRKHCARGLYYDVMSGLCNRAFLVDCNLNRWGNEIDGIVQDIPSLNLGVELGFGEDSRREVPMERVQPQAVTSAPCTTTTCTTTTCTTTTCTTTTCTTTTCTTTTCTTTTCTTTTCTTTTCTTTTCTTTTCSTNPPKKPITTCTTSQTTKKPITTCTTSQTTTCSTKTASTPKTITCFTTPTCTTTTPCNTTPPCTTTSPCTTKPPCSTATTCATTEKPVTGNNRDNKDEQKKEPLQYHLNSRDCLNLADDTILLDFKNCRRFYICSNRRVKPCRCSVGKWFDRETRSCRPRDEVTNCIAK